MRLSQTVQGCIGGLLCLSPGSGLRSDSRQWPGLEAGRNSPSPGQAQTQSKLPPAAPRPFLSSSTFSLMHAQLSVLLLHDTDCRRTVRWALRCPLWAEEGAVHLASKMGAGRQVTLNLGSWSGLSDFMTFYP